MTESIGEQLYMSCNGVRQRIGPNDFDMRIDHESLVRADFDRCHPGDSFEDLKHRAQFSKEDQGLLRDWMTLAADRARERRNAAEHRQAPIAA